MDCRYRYDDVYQSETALAQTFLHTATSQLSDAWFLDSGATHHVTSDVNNLSSFIPYVGYEHLQVGNGTNLSISHRGHSSLSLASGDLKLRDMLHVPHITKNLISISKFTKDNEVFIEFHLSFCVIKDCFTKTLILRANLHNGLYSINLLP